MMIFEGIAAAADAARRFFLKHEDEMPAHVQACIEPYTGTGSSPVLLAARFARAVYANPETMSAEAKQIAAGIADVFEINGYHDRLEGKAAGMRDALRRDSGDAGNWPAADHDPAIDREFAPPPPPPAKEPPAGAAAEPQA